MKLDDGIRKLGFRKWYERELLQSHAHLALTFVCMLGVFAAIEAAWTPQGLHDRAADVATLLLCAGTGIWSLRRYLRLLGHAELAANQADCPACRTYGRLTVERALPEAVMVQCKHCGHRWPIHE